MKLYNRQNLAFYEFAEWQEFPIQHGYTSRLGGVSSGDFAGLQLSDSRGDDPKAVQQNRQLFSQVVSVPLHKMVSSQQVHQTRIERVTETTASIVEPKSCQPKEVDGLSTNVPGILLMTWYADCVPLYAYDPVQRAVAVVHAGWRGTYAQMAKRLVEHMQQEYGSLPQNLQIGIGPAICQQNYEVDSDLQAKLVAILGDKADTFFAQETKPHLDLKQLNKFFFIQAGVPKTQIVVSDVCTKEHSDLFSHRRTGEKRGNNLGFICLTKA